MASVNKVGRDLKKLHAGQLTKTLLAKHGGRGGGKDKFARGGLPDNAHITDVFATLEDLLRQAGQ